MRVLLVDDDVELCQLLDKFLQKEGFTVISRHDGEAGLKAAQAGEGDIVVLDVGLPRLDGFGLLRELRKTNPIPVLMLTARGDDIDRIVGLELGADDYLPKPFNPRELSARLRAILRRTEMRAQAPSDRLEINGVRLDPASRKVALDGSPVDLTTLEFDILHTLMQSAGRVLSRDALMEALYQRKSSPFDRAIDVHISHLRKKLEAGRVIIRTVRGVGYQFCRNAEDAGE